MNIDAAAINVAGEKGSYGISRDFPAVHVERAGSVGTV